MNRRLVALVVLAIAGCALYSDVTIVPLSVQPANIDHPSDLPSMIRKADLVRAVQLAPTIEAKHNRSAQDLAALGSAEMISGRYDDARRHLRAAIDLAPFRTTYSTIAWDLSQLEYMSNNFEASLDWAHIAAEHGMVIKKWYTDYLAALAGVNVYQVSGKRTERISMRASHPDVPRVEARLNKTKSATGIIDPGARPPRHPPPAPRPAAAPQAFRRFPGPLPRPPRRADPRALRAARLDGARRH